MGQGPTVLLLHGTGAATHSWRTLAPMLAERFTVVALDLPGHGFTEALPSHRMSLPGMAAAIAELLKEIDVDPAIAIGHSAGAAILVHMCLDKRIEPRLLISLNGALLPFRGLAGQLFPPMAKLLYLNPFVPRMFAWGAGDGARVERLLRDTGSTIDAEGRNLYTRLLRRSSHVGGALRMMANWQLQPLERALPRLQTPLILVTGENDRAVPPRSAEEVGRLVPGARVVRLPGLGHLAHEEKPERIDTLVTELAQAESLLSDA